MTVPFNSPFYRCTTPTSWLTPCMSKGVGWFAKQSSQGPTGIVQGGVCANCPELTAGWPTWDLMHGRMFLFCVVTIISRWSLSPGGRAFQRVPATLAPARARLAPEQNCCLMTKWADFQILFKLPSTHTTQSKEWKSGSAPRAHGRAPAVDWSLAELKRQASRQRTEERCLPPPSKGMRAFLKSAKDYAAFRGNWGRAVRVLEQHVQTFMWEINAKTRGLWGTHKSGVGTVHTLSPFLWYQAFFFFFLILPVFQKFTHLFLSPCSLFFSMVSALHLWRAQT